MDKRSSAESIEERLVIVRGIIDDSNPNRTTIRIIIITKHNGTRYLFEMEMSYSGRNLSFPRMEQHWTLDNNHTPLPKWVQFGSKFFGSKFNDVFQLVVTRPGQVYICRTSAPDESISPVRHHPILPLLAAILGRISNNARPKDDTFLLYSRFSRLLAEILEEAYLSEEQDKGTEVHKTPSIPISDVKIDLTDDEIAQIDTARLARMLGMDEEQIKRSVRNKGSVGEETREDILRATTIDELFRLSLNVAPCTADEDACFRAIGWVAFRKSQV